MLERYCIDYLDILKLSHKTLFNVPSSIKLTTHVESQLSMSPIMNWLVSRPYMILQW